MKFQEVTVSDKDCKNFRPASAGDWMRCERILRCKTGIARMEKGVPCNGMEEELKQGYCSTCMYGPEPCDKRKDAGAKPPYDAMLGELVECREWRGIIVGEEEMPEPPEGKNWWQRERG